MLLVDRLFGLLLLLLDQLLGLLLLLHVACLAVERELMARLHAQLHQKVRVDSLLLLLLLLLSCLLLSLCSLLRLVPHNTILLLLSLIHI